MVISGFIFTGCGKKGGEVVAKAGNYELTLDELKSNFNSAEWDTMSQDIKRDFIRQWIDLSLLSSAAEEIGLNKKQIVKYKLDNARKKTLSNALISYKLSEIKVSEEEIFNFYRTHKAEYLKNTVEYKIQRILVRDQVVLQDLVSKLDSGEIKFTEAANIYSQESLGKSGGLLGWVTENDSDKSFWNTANGMELWDYKSIQNSDGLFLVRYVDKREIEGERTFEQAKPDITRRLIETKKMEVYNNLIESLKSENEIIISL